MTLETLIKQKSYEKIMFTVRRHPITFLPYVIFFILLLVAPLGVFWLISNSSLNQYFQTQIGFIISVLGASIYYLSSYLFFYTNFVTFHLDMWVITNDRLLEIEQKGLFYRTVSELDLYQIEDATSEVNGFFGSLFNYGDITLQTAAAVPKFNFKNLPNPNYLREQVLNLSSEDKRFHEHDNA